MTPIADPLRAVWLGRRRYGEVLDLQVRLFEALKNGAGTNTLLLLEHEPVITLGRGAAWSNLLVSREELERRGIDLVPTNRGGDVTLHAPGQLVIYPILTLPEGRRDVRRFVRDLTAVMQAVCAERGIATGEAPGMVGLWADAVDPQHFSDIESAALPRKVGAIGVRISRWVTMHGLALNLSVDLSLYRLIVPCGISRYEVTSMEQLTGSAPTCHATAERALEHLCERFGVRQSELLDFDGQSLDAIV